MRGRPPKTTAQHKADGTLRSNRHSDRSDHQWPSNLPEPPADLTPYALRMWRRYVEIAPPGIIATIDFETLEQACRWAAIASELTTFVEHNPLQIDVLKAAATATQKYYGYTSKLGLSPVDRARIKLDTGTNEDDDPMVKLLKMTESA